MGKKIAVVLTDYFEDVEFTEPAKAFKDAGHEITVIENEKGKTVKGKQGEAEVRVDASIDNVKPEDFDALLIMAASHQTFCVRMIATCNSQKPLWTRKNQYLRSVMDRNCLLQRRRWKEEARPAIHPFK